MKIYVYDMVDFEEEILTDIKNNCSDDIILSKESLIPETLEAARGCDGISVLGYSKVDETLLTKMKEYGILYLSTRTIGYDHIDIKAAQ